MRIWMQRTLSLVLVVSLLLSGSVVLATETDETQPAESIEETVATENAETTEEAAEEAAEPEFEVDTTTQIYKVCANTAAGLNYDQLLVYDATNDKLIFSDTREGSKLYPASVTKLFTSYVVLQVLDPDEVVTIGEELDLVHAGSSVRSEEHTLNSSHKRLSRMPSSA